MSLELIEKRKNLLNESSGALYYIAWSIRTQNVSFRNAIAVCGSAGSGIPPATTGIPRLPGCSGARVAQPARYDAQNGGAGSGCFRAPLCATRIRRRKYLHTLLLRRIAAALNVSLAELFSLALRARTRKRMIGEFWNGFRRIGSRKPAPIDARTGARREDPAARIALIGLRGAGKSTLGAKLSRDMNIPFIELDREIEKDAGIALAEIFSLYGQAGYRRIEKRTLDRVLKDHARAIISIGGGVVSEKATYDRVLANCLTVWVKATPEDHMSRVIAQRDFRVVGDDNEAMDDLRRILEARETLYRRADIHLETSGESVDESLAKLKQAVQTETK